MPDDIQARALSTWHSDRFPVHLQRLHAAMGLAGEAGELLELVKKEWFKPGHKFDFDAYASELGDCLYYLAILAHGVGLTLDELSRLNAAKLANGHGWEPDYNRYGDG